jgi:hypothetical protein
MRRQWFSITLMTLGLVALAIGMAGAPLAQPVAAAPLLQPSPRPTLLPTSAPPTPEQPTPENPTTEPTTDPGGGGGGDDGGGGGGGGDREPASLPGRITGTVIDRRTGAPASGIRVSVGEELLATDGNGNYDVYLPAGNYVVSLVLSAGQGTPAQGPQEVGLAAEEVEVVHLFFNSPVAAVPTTPPTVAPVATTAPSPVATAAPPVAVVLPELPNTSTENAPATLPTTAAPFSLGSPWVWMLLGSCLLAAGTLYQLVSSQRKPRRRARRRD